MSGKKIDDDAFEKQLAALRRGYIAHLPGKWDEIAALAKAVAQNPSAVAARGKIVKIHEIAHNLSGSGGSYGAPGIGDAAGDVERACEAILESGKAASAAEWPEVERLIGRLKAALDAFLLTKDG